MFILFTAAGILCILYFFFLLLYTGFTSSFYLVWPAMGAGFMALAQTFRLQLWQQVPAVLRSSLLIFCAVCLLFFLGVEGMILKGAWTEPADGLDYVIVLGAHVRPEGSSRALALRLDRALEYAADNPQTTVIVSGGQGDNEPCTEASAMKSYLMRHGMEAGRILEEDRSENTRQNLAYSRRMIPAGASAGIVSNDFHICRALHLARELGYENVCGIPAKSDLPTQPANLLREFFAVVKDFWIL